MRTRFALQVFAVLMLLASLGTPLIAGAQGTITYFITDVDAGQFPDVSFRLRALDINNQVVSNLNNANVSVYENGGLVPQIEVTPHEDGPMHIVFVIDQGIYSNYAYFGLPNIRLAMTQLVTGGYFVDDRDTVMVMARQNITSDQSVVLWPATQKGADLTNWAANFSFPRTNNRTKGLLAVEDAMNALGEQVPVPGSATTAIIFITRFIEDPNTATAIAAAETLARTARDRHIRIYTLHTDFSGTYRDPLRILADGSFGTYTALGRNTVATAVDAIYQQLSAQRTYYTVSYRSSLGASGQRRVTINTPDPGTTGLAGTYEVDVQPPALSILQPAAGSTLRREAERVGDNWVYSTNQVTVTASVDWPAGTNPRRLRTASLRVRGEMEDQYAPEPGDQDLQFVWDVADITSPGANQVVLEVTVVDELGMEQSTDARLTVEVIPPPQPTAEPTSTPGRPGGGDGTQFDLMGWLTDNWLVALGVVVCGGMAVLAVALAAFLLRPRGGRGGRVSPVPGAARATAAAGAANDHTMIVGGGPAAGSASLTVLEGPRGMVGESLPLSKPITVIGRNSQMADIVFYADVASSLSRSHATLTNEAGTYQVMDNQSANGTRVNGQLLPARAPVPLRNGDEIVLGDLSKLGVKLRFNLGPAGRPAAGGDLQDRTFIVDNWSADELDKFKDS